MNPTTPTPKPSTTPSIPPEKETMRIFPYILLFSSSFVFAKKNETSVPILFLDIGPTEKLKIMPCNYHSNYFPDDAKSEERVKDIEFMAYGESAFIVSNGPRNEPWRRPMKFVTSSLVNRDATGVLSCVNRVRLRQKKSGSLDIGIDFDLIDLLGCASNREFYEFVDNLNSDGTLILPFAGVDFTLFKKMPERVKRLVVYNSDLHKGFDRLISSMTSLEEVVLWGCRYDDPNLIGSRSLVKRGVCDKPNSFPNMGKCIRSLKIINCTPWLNYIIQWQDMPNLEKIETTSYWRERRQWMTAQSDEFIKITKPELHQPEYPKLKSVIFYDSNYSIIVVANGGGGRENQNYFRRNMVMKDLSVKTILVSRGDMQLRESRLTDNPPQINQVTTDAPTNVGTFDANPK